jgi:hypothetical protein
MNDDNANNFKSTKTKRTNTNTQIGVVCIAFLTSNLGSHEEACRFHWCAPLFENIIKK